MNKQEFAKGLKILELTYNQKFDEEKRDFWYRQLQDLDAERFFNNIKQLYIIEKIKSRRYNA